MSETRPPRNEELSIPPGFERAKTRAVAHATPAIYGGKYGKNMDQLRRSVLEKIQKPDREVYIAWGWREGKDGILEKIPPEERIDKTLPHLSLDSGLVYFKYKFL